MMILMTSHGRHRLQDYYYCFDEADADANPARGTFVLMSRSRRWAYLGITPCTWNALRSRNQDYYFFFLYTVALLLGARRGGLSRRGGMGKGNVECNKCAVYAPALFY